MVDRTVARVHARTERAKHERAEYVEITHSEYAHLRDLTPPAPPIPDDWPTWAKEWRFVPPEGADGVIFGFPCKVVPKLERSGNDNG